MPNDTANVILQADLAKSTEAIAKQLPRLEEALARRGKLKIQAEVDTGALQKQALNAMRQVQSLIAGQPLSIALNMDKLVLSGQLTAWMQKNRAEAQRLQAQLDRMTASLNSLSGSQALSSLSGALSAVSSGSAGKQIACAA